MGIVKKSVRGKERQIWGGGRRRKRRAFEKDDVHAGA